MIKQLLLLKAPVFKHKTTRLSFLASLKSRFIPLLCYGLIVYVMLGCVDLEQIITPGVQDTVKVGLVIPMALQISTRYGAALAVSQINREGGINGRPLELIIKDGQNNPELFAKLTEELITKDGIVALVGANFSRNALKVAPVAQRYGVPLVTTTPTNPAITEAGDFVFMAAFSDDFQGKTMARFARESLKAQTAAILTDKGDPYVDGLSKFFEENFTALGGRIVANENYSAGDTDFTDQLTAIAAGTPDVVFMPGFVPEVPLAVKQARTIPQKAASGITATFLGGDGWDDPNLVKMGDTAIEDCYFSCFFSPDSTEPSTRDFVLSYRSMFGIAPDGPAAMGYDAVKLVATAMRRSGSLKNTAIRDELAATRGYKGATSIASYDENRHPQKSAVIMRIHNGQVQFHQQVEP